MNHRSLPAAVFLFSLFFLNVQADTLLNEPIKPILYPDAQNPALEELGRSLFHDVRLSDGEEVSCASCHSFAMGGADGQIVSSGVKGQNGTINSPSVFNSDLNFRQFWDGRAADLWQQIDGPITNPVEMNSSWEKVLTVLSQDPFYLRQFNALFDDGMTIKNIKQAIIHFEKGLRTPDSRFDRYLKGEVTAITIDELTGYQLFKSYGCVACHQGVAVGGNLFQKFGAFGDFFADKEIITQADLGRFNVTGNPNDKHVFKVPSLRNVELTAPYFHDGSEKTLSGAVTVMMKYQLGREPVEQDVTRIVRFLKTLTGKYNNKLLSR